MPGLHLVVDWRRGVAERRPAILAALDGVRHSDAYDTRVLVEDDIFLLARSGYAEYPVECFEVNGVRVVLEGRLYGVSEAARAGQIGELAERVFEDSAAQRERLREWLLAADGDFLIVLLQRATGEIAVLNDMFGRLPVYHRRSPAGLVASRELRFSTRLADRLAFDRLALAQSLLLGFALGERTLVEGLERLPPGTLLRCSPRRQEVRLERLHRVTLQPKPHAGRTLSEHATHLVDLFAEACRARRDAGAELVLSLSGGFDSRAVGACLVRQGTPFRCATFLDHVGTAAPDVPIARQLAALFAAPWDLFRLGPPRPHDVLTLLRMKSGLNPLGMAFLLPFLHAVRETASRPVQMITGEMGTFTLTDPRPPRVPATARDLLEEVMAENRRFSLADAAALTGIAPGDLADTLERHVAGYPEEDYRQKYAHFRMCERAFNWQGEAEDRNRCYFWTTSPFYAPRFFRAAIGGPDEHKARYRLYRDLLVRLSPAAAAIPHAGLGVAVTAPSFETASRVATLLGADRRSRETLIRRLGHADGYGPDSTVVRCLRQQVAACEPLAGYLSLAAVARVVDASAHHTRAELDQLFTVTSTIEDLTTGTTALERRL
jgi:asparagine synthase (glutamine-hydrolysing)